MAFRRQEGEKKNILGVEVLHRTAIEIVFCFSVTQAHAVHFAIFT